MKRIIIISMLCFLILSIQAQNPYSVENLQKLSQEELDLYFNNAIKLQKTGKIVNIVGLSILGGTTATIVGMAVVDNGDWALGAVVVAFFGGMAGVGTLAVGIPMNISGKKRVERINSIRNTAFHDLSFEIKPCTQYNIMTQHYQPAVTVHIKF